jgi:DNA-binding response OmpR family regulator
LKFLVVEDEDALLTIYKMELLDYFQESEVDLATNGAEGLELVSKNSYDFIITDGRMPVMGGVEFAEKVRNQKLELPIVLVTGFTDDMHEQYTQSLFDRILEKPLDFDIFLREIDTVIKENAAKG